MTVNPILQLMLTLLHLSLLLENVPIHLRNVLQKQLWSVLRYFGLSMRLQKFSQPYWGCHFFKIALSNYCVDWNI